MMLLQHTHALPSTHVLPSNAPPEVDSVHEASRVLQEHSGNRQQSDFSLKNEYEQKYPSSILTENHYQHHYDHQSQQPAQHQYAHLYHPRPQHRQPTRYGTHRGQYGQFGPEEEARTRVEADRLFQRFKKSDQYIKYRQRQTKDDKGNGDQKWPDHLEKAFFLALVRWRPMGRRKIMHKDKQRGRNELIADCIEELTGDHRTRKQVSSHIQVLKPFVENDPLIMKYLSKEDMCGPAGKHNSHSSFYNSGRRMSGYPVTAPPPGLRTGMPTLSRLDPYRIQQLKGNLDVFEPIDFQMFVQQKYRTAHDHEETRRLHTYTHSGGAALGANLNLDLHSLNRDFPLLGAMHAQRPLDCSVLVAEAPLAFPTESWKEKDGSPLPGIELGIYFLCGSHHFPPTIGSTMMKDSSKLIVNNTFYENGHCVKEHSGPSEITRWEPSERASGADTQIKFGSQFWARTLGRLAAKLLNKDNREDVATVLKNITALQEVVLSSELGHERILVIHWSFRLSNSGRGRASWRKLSLPTQDSGQPKNERVDSLYDYSAQTTDELNSHQQQQQHVVQPALQSPFEYDSGSASALSSATWPTSISDGSFGVQGYNGTDFSAENSFDFNAGNINVDYDPDLTFMNFDSATFNFDVSDFAADPALQDYSQPWYDDYSTGFGVEQNGVLEGANGYAQSNSQAPYIDYDGRYEQHHYVEDQSQQSYVSAHEQQGSYDTTHDQQAYGGAGHDALRDEDALAALADASYIASAMSLKQERV